MALYWTSGSDWNLAAGGSHWSLIDELEHPVRGLAHYLGGGRLALAAALGILRRGR